MQNIEFDKKIREMVDSYQEPLNEDLWGGIEKRMNRQRRVIWVRTISAVAVAASLAVGLFLFPEQEKTAPLRVVSLEADPVEIDSKFLPLKGRLYLKDRTINKEVLAVVDEPETKTSEMQKEVVTEPQSVPEVKASADVKETSETYAGLQDVWMEEEDYEKGRKGMVLGISSNMLALSNSTSPVGRPQYVPGASMNVQSGIVPITKPSFMIPMTFGLQLQFPVTERFAIGTGVAYTYLQSSFQALKDNTSQVLVDQKLHYIGVPLSLYLDIIKGKHFSCYLNGGAALEKGLQASTKVQDIFDGVTYVKEGIQGVQWSANIGIGLQYLITDLIGIYFDPSLVYFFDNNQPFSVRTSQPFQMEMELGLRFNL